MTTSRKLGLFSVAFAVMGIGLVGGLNAQSQGNTIDFEHYSGLRCAGELPVDFRETSISKAHKAQAKIADKDLTRSDRQQESEHAVRSIFEVDELLMSGRVLFGDPLSQFVESVAEKVLKANDREDLLDDLRFYVLKSQEVNAYATSNGVVMVTVGLLSRIENESQLAFILAHEIQHYVLKHSLQQYKYRKVQRKKSSKLDEDGALKDMYQFSKDHEMEADEKGFQMMLRSGYDLVEGVFVFDMLKYGDFPFLEMKLALDSFEHDAYRFPKALKDAVAMQVQAAEIEDAKYLEQEGNDDNKTHPSLDRRVVRLRDMIDGEPKKAAAFFLVGEQRFKEMQRLARYELLMIYARRADYGELFYLTQVMRKLYGQGLFFDKMEAMSLYGLLLHDSKEHDLDRYGCGVSASRGDWRAVIVGLRELDLKGLGAFASMRVWAMASREPGVMKDDQFAKIAKGVYALAQDACNFRLQDFLDYLPAEEAAKLDSTLVKPEVGEGGLRNPRSRVARSRAANVVSGDYHMAIFYGLGNREFLQAFLANMKVYTTTTVAESQKSVKKKKQFKGLEDFHHLVLIEPNVNRTVGNDVNSTRDPFDEADKRAQLSGYWEQFGEDLGVKVEVIPTSTGVKGLTTEMLNRQMMINDWMMERINNDTQSMILFGGDQMPEAMGGEKNRYLAWTAVESSRIGRKFKLSNLLLCMVLYPILPYYLYYQLGTDRTYEEFLLVYDVHTGKLMQVREREYTHHWRSDFVKSRVFNNMYYLVHGGK